MTDVGPLQPSGGPPLISPPILVTDRLRLRPLRRFDAAEIALHASDAKVARMTERIPHPYPPGAAEALIEHAASGRSGVLTWAIDSGEDGENGLIGTIALRLEADGTGRIGYWVAPALWGAGYASEAVEAVKAHSLASGIPALTARVFQDNIASVKVLTRAGFVYVGEGETYALSRGGMVPTFRYRLELTR